MTWTINNSHEFPTIVMNLMNAHESSLTFMNHNELLYYCHDFSGIILNHHDSLWMMMSCQESSSIVINCCEFSCVPWIYEKKGSNFWKTKMRTFALCIFYEPKGGSPWSCNSGSGLKQLCMSCPEFSFNLMKC